MVRNEIEEFKSVKISFALKAKFSIVRNDETQTMEHYFHEDEPQFITINDEDNIEIRAFDDFVEMMKGEIEAWSALGSGWVV